MSRRMDGLEGAACRAVTRAKWPASALADRCMDWLCLDEDGSGDPSGNSLE